MNIKQVIVLSGALMLLLLFTCNNKPSKPSVVISHTSDTTIVHDTIVDTLIVQHTHIIPSKIDTLILSDSNTFRHKYYYPVKDSLLDGLITAKSNDRPQIDFKYKLKNYHTSTYTTIKDTIVISNHGFMYGGDVVVSPLLSEISVAASYQNKKGNLFDLSIGRNFTLNQNIIKLGYRRKF